MDEVIFLYVTAPNESAADAIADALVEVGLAACVNILPHVRSAYRWKGAMARSQEVAMVIKTTTRKAGAARAAIERLHPYETPVIAAIRLDDNNSGLAFLNWVRDELAETNS